MQDNGLRGCDPEVVKDDSIGGGFKRLLQVSNLHETEQI